MSAVADLRATSDLRLLASRSETAFRRFRSTPIEQRAALLARVAELLERDRDAHALLISNEMGKTIRAATAEVEKCARLCRWYATDGVALLADEQVTPQARIRFEPLGVVLGVMPWNFPLWQVFRFAVPALLAGNCVVIRHSSLVPRCAAAIEQVFGEAGFGDGVVQVAFTGHDGVYELVADERIRAVVFTGGEQAGSAIAAHAARHVKKTILELGGSDAFIVMPTADIDGAVEAAVRSRIHSNGQACTAAKRFIVHRAVAGTFENRLVARMQALRVGDPLDPAIDVGPLASEAIARTLEEQLCDTLARGGRLCAGGTRQRSFFAPTVVADVPRDSRLATEETFGPVAALFRVADLDEAIALANDTRYGLGASVWTSDAVEVARFTDELEVGLVFVNALVSSDPRLPFGGVKRSGFGRELGELGIRELTNVKTVWLG